MLNGVSGGSTTAIGQSYMLIHWSISNYMFYLAWLVERCCAAPLMRQTVTGNFRERPNSHGTYGDCTSQPSPNIQRGPKATSLVALRAAGARSICGGFADVTRIPRESGVPIICHAKICMCVIASVSFKCCAHLPRATGMLLLDSSVLTSVKVVRYSGKVFGFVSYMYQPYAYINRCRPCLYVWTSHAVCLPAYKM
jgi:hypothetical protein